MGIKIWGSLMVKKPIQTLFSHFDLRYSRAPNIYMYFLKTGAGDLGVGLAFPGSPANCVLSSQFHPARPLPMPGRKEKRVLAHAISVRPSVHPSICIECMSWEDLNHRRGQVLKSRVPYPSCCWFLNFASTMLVLIGPFP